MAKFKSSKTNRRKLLVLRAQTGDRDAISGLLLEHQGELFRYLDKMLGDTNDAEDALQATLIQATNKIRHLRDPGLFRAWAFRIASRCAYRIISKRNRRREVSNLDDMNFVESEFESEHEPPELAEQLAGWLDRLSVKGREAILLRYFDGFALEQIAEILDIPVGTVKSRIGYSLSRMRQWTLDNGDNQ